MKLILEFKRKAFFRDVLLLTFLGILFPCSLIPSFQKTGLLKFTILSLIDLIIFSVIFYRLIYRHYLDVLKMNKLPFVEGVIVETYNVGWRSARYEAAIEVPFQGKKVVFISKYRRHVGYKKGAICPVLLDTQDVANSILLEDSPYISYKRV